MKVGIVGCGSISKTHVKALLKNRGIEVVSVCDIDEKRAKYVANRWGIKSSYKDYSDMLNEQDLDLVHVLTPPRSHAAISIKAMDTGCHVMVEKPMAMSLAEADRMIAASKRNDARLCVVHNRLFNPAFERAKRLVKDGVIGDVVYVDTFWGVYSARLLKKSSHQWMYSLPGGVFGELIPHPVYLELALLKNINDVHVITKKTGRIPWIPFEEVHVLLDAENAVGAISISNSVTVPFTMDIYGTKAVLHINLDNLSMVKQRVRDAYAFMWRAIRDAESGLQLLTGSASLIFKRLLKMHKTDHEFLINKFIESIERNINPPVKGEDGKEVIRVLEMLWNKISS